MSRTSEFGDTTNIGTPKGEGQLHVDAPDLLDRAQKWRLVLGERGSPPQDDPAGVQLQEDWKAADQVIDELYEADKRGGLAKSSAKLTKWLGQLRSSYPPEAIQLMQRDAIERYELTRLLAEPEILETLEPDVHLAATLLQLGRLLPEKARAMADKVVEDIASRLAKKLEEPLLRAVRSALASGELRTHAKPNRHTDWGRTILKNLKNYQPSLKTIIPERFVNRQAKGRGLRNVHLLVDQSASMATSAIHAALAAAVMAKLPSLRVRLVAFDTELADLSDLLSDPVETLFGVQLGGGTDIHRALRYEEQFMQSPTESLVVLISDLYEGGSKGGVVRRMQAMIDSGVKVICLLALSDEGRPSYDQAFAKTLTELGAVVFSTTPDAFPDMMAAALRGESLVRFGESIK